MQSTFSIEIYVVFRGVIYELLPNKPMVATMCFRAVFDVICIQLRRFVAADRGNVMITFALATIPLIGFVGAAVDYSRANSTKAAMQAAVDSTALMLSRDAQKLNQTQLIKKATDYFKAQLHRPEAQNIVVTPTFTAQTSGYKVNVAATAKVPTSFTRIVGQDYMDITVSSQVVWGIRKLELVLALDNTGSMASSNKMTELKKAAKSLVDTLKAVSQNDDDIKIAIVPFAQEVNVGLANVTASWLNWTHWDANNGTCINALGKKQGQCTTNGGTWVPNIHATWNGCVMDRDQDHDVLDTSPTTSIASTLFPAVQAGSCPTELLPLVSVKSDYGKLINKIATMNPQGMTNVTIGLVWGWHALSTSSPLTQGKAPNPGTDKVIVLLTDGDNTRNRWTANSGQIDARTKKVCGNVKASNIKLYTIRVIDGNAALLKQCATKPEMFFNVQSASQLNAVFAQIANSLANLRIAK